MSPISRAIKTELQRQVSAQLAADGYQAGRTAFVWEADLRHEGQATELTVPFEGEDFDQIAANASSPNISRPTAIATTRRSS